MYVSLFLSLYILLCDSRLLLPLAIYGILFASQRIMLFYLMLLRIFSMTCKHLLKQIYNFFHEDKGMSINYTTRNNLITNITHQGGSTANAVKPPCTHIARSFMVRVCVNRGRYSLPYFQCGCRNYGSREILWFGWNDTVLSVSHFWKTRDRRKTKISDGVLQERKITTLTFVTPSKKMDGTKH